MSRRQAPVATAITKVIRHTSKGRQGKSEIRNPKAQFRKRPAGTLFIFLPPCTLPSHFSDIWPSALGFRIFYSSHTSETLLAPTLSKNLSVRVLSNLGSSVSIQRKKRSIEARSNSGTLKTG